MREIHLRQSAAIAFGITALVIGGLIGTLAVAKTNRAVPVYANVQPGNPAAAVSFENGFAPVMDRVLPAVVNISSTKVVKVPGGNPSPFLNDPFFRQFFGRGFGGQTPPQQEREHSLGSGVIVSADGYILTNNHVVEGASDITIALPDRRVAKGRIVGSDSKTDIAVVKINEGKLPVMPMGDSSKVRTGQFVLAIGDPFGVGETATMGIVSAIGRGGLGIENYEDFIQTDAAINPGNSGGALVDVNGRLIGVNTAILTGGGSGNQGVGFAIPINMASHVMRQVITKGKVTRGWLGVAIQPLTPDLARAFNLQKDQGALVGGVDPASPAARAGLQQGDVILALNGQPVADARALSLATSQMQPGATVRLTVWRNGKTMDISATLGEQPAPSEQSADRSAPTGAASPLQGLSVDNLTPDIARQIEVPANTRGVVITDVADGSVASEAGLQAGDVIQEVNHRPVRNIGEFSSAVKQSGNKPVLLLVNHGGVTGYAVIPGQ